MQVLISQFFVGPGSVGEGQAASILARPFIGVPQISFLNFDLGLSLGLRGIRAGFVFASAACIGVVQMEILSYLVRYVVSGFPGGVSPSESFPEHEIVCGIVLASTFQQPFDFEQLSLVLHVALRAW